MTSGTHVRDTAAHEERQPQGRLGDARSLQHRYHARYPLSCAPQHASQRRPCSRRSPPLTRCSIEPRHEHRGTSFASGLSLFLQELLEYRRSDSNRHGAFAPPDFESSEPRPGASYRVAACGIDKGETRDQPGVYPSVSGSVLYSIAAALLPLLPRATGVITPYCC
jgi:hypothetical protein